MNRILDMAVAAVVAVGVMASIPAHAGTTYGLVCFNHFCTVTQTANADPQVIHVAPAEIDPAHEKAWQEFCKPHVVTDDEGIGRYVYAHKNCDLGVIQ